MNLYLSVCSTTQYDDDIKTMTFYSKHLEIRISYFLGGIITETNFYLILSSPDDECFQIIILFLVSGQYIYPVQSKIELQSIILTRKWYHSRNFVCVSAPHLVLTSQMLVLTIVTVLQFCKLRYKCLQGLLIFIFDIVSRIMCFCKLYTHQVIVCARNLNPRCYGL